ncbi:hypothetical protein GALMADRAFT_1344851 [Galerina marginata CBS 339.88]|uniref:4Fe-4S ferredoxin-type domain-containing protein n=1 Tax=Galerina marginata (strain CBS 339.88) TaxID=685588 RepID=A0A067SPA7_GALM3|nr:hypothetical protein GALMADRAFT_1344851 [Galerina marginata CBS 339.88]
MKFTPFVIFSVVSLFPMLASCTPNPQTPPVNTCVGNAGTPNCGTFCASCCANFPTALECLPTVKTCARDCPYKMWICNPWMEGVPKRNFIVDKKEDAVVAL